VYADIAFTLGAYLRALKPDSKHSSMDVCDMLVKKPLIAKDEGSSQYFRVSATADWATQTARMLYYSVNAKGEKTVDHAKCTVRYGNPDEWVKEWNRMSFLVKIRVSGLVQGINSGQSHKIKRGIVYRLFATLVDYGQSFRGMDEVILNSSNLEAMARVTFQTSETENNFHSNPYWLDSMGHISGFVMNASDKFNPKEQAFINHGWESWRYSKKLLPGKTYTTYVMMQSESGTMYSGNVYMFEGNDLIGCCQGVKVSRPFNGD
jgi:naphtho-gamma-pyrone polyketide synthase